MPNITIKNIPADMYEELKKYAAARHRSVNSQVIACLENALRRESGAAGEHLKRARALRARTARPVSAEEFRRAREEGRA